MTTTEAPPAARHVDRNTIEQFLYTEADLLDRRQFTDWLALFTQDALYWIPSGFDELDPNRSVSIIYDTYPLLAERVQRLGGGLAYAQVPPSRTSRLIGNIQIANDDADPSAISVKATFVVAEFRRQNRYLQAGRVSYTLVDTPDGLRIKFKKVELIDNDGYLGNLSMPL
jgi:3-phenylpropionate/cinnamic acid dioxygenase small subunit